MWSSFKDLARHLFLFSLPLQLGYHFWPSFSFVWGLPVDYLAPTLYLSDLCFLLWWAASGFPLPQIPLWPLLLAGGGNILFSSSPLLALLGWGRILQIVLLAHLAKRQASALRREWPKVAAGWLGMQLVLVALQLRRQQSVGGWAWWLGEREFSVTTPGVATLSLGGRRWLRGYGSFSHPNSLAGFALVASLVSPTPLLFLLFSLLALATFSRATLLVASLLWGRKGVVFLPFLLLGLKWGARGAFSSRWEGIKIGLRLWWHHPLFGVGAKQFIPQMASFLAQEGRWAPLQPVHNIFLLWLVEEGLVGTGWLFSWLSPTLRPPLVALLLTGLFDHYWLTLPQNRLLLGLVLGLL